MYKIKSGVIIVVPIILTFIITPVFTFIETFLSFFHMALSYCLVSFHVTLQDALEHFLHGRSNDNEIP